MTTPTALDWTLTAIGLLFTLGGTVALPWFLFADRSRGRRRCPKCWYDMSGTPGHLVCPECGHDARKERRLFRTRRRHGRAAIGVIASGTGLVMIIGFGVTANAVVNAIPLGVWERVLPSFDRQAARAYKDFPVNSGLAIFVSSSTSWTPPVTTRLQRLLAAQELANMMRRGTISLNTWTLGEIAPSLGAEAELAQDAAIAQLDSPDEWLRRNAATVLEWLSINPERAFAKMQARLLVEKSALVDATLLSACERRKMFPCDEALYSAARVGDRETAFRVVRALLESGRPAVDLLARFCELENTDIQREAADGLSFHAEQAAPATGVLIHLLASSDAEVRIRSAGALHMIGAGGVAAAPTLRVMLRDDPNDTARVVACYAIGSVDPHNSDTLSVMIPALADRYATVREVAVEQIAALGQAGAGAESRIRSLLLDPDDRVREAAGRAIKAIVPNER